MLNQQLEQLPKSFMRNQEEQVTVSKEASAQTIVPEEASAAPRRSSRAVHFDIHPVDTVNAEPTTNALLFPTMPDLNRVTSRKSSRTRKQPKRYGFSNTSQAVMSAK